MHWDFITCQQIELKSHSFLLPCSRSRAAETGPVGVRSHSRHERRCVEWARRGAVQQEGSSPGPDGGGWLRAAARAQQFGRAALPGALAPPARQAGRGAARGAPARPAARAPAEPRVRALGAPRAPVRPAPPPAVREARAWPVRAEAARPAPDSPCAAGRLGRSRQINPHFSSRKWNSGSLIKSWIEMMAWHIKNYT